MEALIAKWYAHGKSVHEWYLKLIDDPSIIGDAKTIEWFKNYKPRDLKPYHVFHDCGKPFCIEYGEDGKEHYPNHSEISYQTYIEMFGEAIPFREYAEMILHDMDFHTKRGTELVEVWNLPYADHLYASAWAEIFANAEIFGGVESESFKIKRKRLVKALGFLGMAESLD